MSLLHASYPPAFALLGWILLAPVVALALRAARRDGFLPQGGQQHAWLAGVVCLALLWTLQIRLGDGAAFGMLGAALYVLLFGWSRALLGLLCALLLHTALTRGEWASLGINGQLLAVLPATLATGLQRALARWLPNNLFVFIIGNGMFVTLVTTAAISALLLAVSLGWAAAPAAAGHFGEYLGYALLLAWGEALASGMIFSALVIFTPDLVLTYRADLYLPPRFPRH